MRIRYPIRYKFLFVTTLLLTFSVVAYLLLASHIFRRDKVELVFDLNRSAVSSLASEVGQVFQGIGDKMKLAAILSMDGSETSRAALNDVLDGDGNVIFMAASYGFKSLDQTFFVDKTFADTYGVNEAYLQTGLATQRPIPFQEIQTQGEAIWNATVAGGPPLIGFGKSVEPELRIGRSSEQGSAQGPAQESAQALPARFALVAFIRSDRLLKALTESRLSEVVAVNQNGEVLLHPRAEQMTQVSSLAQHPLFRLATTQKVRTGVSHFNYEGRDILGAYSASQNGKLILLAQVDGSVAFSAVERLIERSLIFASIAITLAFLVAVFFSRSLTRPIQALVEAMKRVSEGELDTRIDLRSNDETALLASSFNTMIRDLKLSREKLEEANRDLEQKVRDRTKKLEEQNVAVKKAQEALLQSTRLAAVGEVAGRAAHEVLNPLTSIVTRLEKVRLRLLQPAQEVQLVRDIVSSWEADVSDGGFPRLVENWQNKSSVDDSITLWQEDLENVKHVEVTVSREMQELMSDTDFLLKESGRINKIVQSMRELTRVRDDLKIVRARDLVKEAVNIMADLCHQHEILIEEIQEVQDDWVQVDVDEFIQCATNLLRNSIQAIQSRVLMEPGLKGRITVTTQAVTTQMRNDIVQIEIKDNGVGIKTEDSSKLFEVQFSTKSKDEGTGLGLSISRRFIRAFGGDIRLSESAWMGGCAFNITLPLAQASAEQPDEKKVAS